MKRLLAALLAFCALATAAPAQQKVTLKVDAATHVGPMDPIWAWFGYDEPNYTTMKDGRKLLSEIAELSPVPVYVRAHNLMTSGDRVAVEGNSYSLEEMLANSIREQDDVSALASISDHSLAVMVWDYHDDNINGKDTDVTLQISGIPTGKAVLKHYRIDAEHSNSYETWLAMGSPQKPTRKQYKTLEDSGKPFPFWYSSGK